ncbi:MAG: hypothetical protein KDD11_01340 [Acidobacteria bacterium]|nr:hypothetical protein [Acidobacteriota bacterium]
MRDGDVAPYWGYYDDRFLRTRLAAEPADDRVVARNDDLAEWTTTPGALGGVGNTSFFPPALAAGVRRHSVHEVTMTGGRTFLLSREASRKLGFPELALDLDRLGWGHGSLEVRLEVKGAGTLFERTRIGQTELERLLATEPELRATYESECHGLGPPVLMSSRAEYLKRNIGGQSERFARHAVETSARLLGRSAIKFVPVWAAVAQSPRVHRNLDLVSGAVDPEQPRWPGSWVTELRLTPSSVRALYFDKVETDEHLVQLCRRVSEDPGELAEAGEEILADARRHLELLAASTRPAEPGACYWIKVGDINEKFKLDPRGRPLEAERFRRQRIAWFFAKDEVVVRRVGKFFVDMEGFFGRDLGFRSAEADLDFHHRLTVLAILRDHNRIATRFRLAVLLAEGRKMADVSRRQLQKDVMAELVETINRSPLVTFGLGRTEAEVILEHPALGGQRHRYLLPRDELAEWYR